jgi:hypothetical protein
MKMSTLKLLVPIVAITAVTTLYMAFYVDSLAPDENRSHAMGYYVGTLALGYSTGNFFGGLMADHLGSVTRPISAGWPRASIMQRAIWGIFQVRL